VESPAAAVGVVCRCLFVFGLTHILVFVHTSFDSRSIRKWKCCMQVSAQKVLQVPRILSFDPAPISQRLAGKMPERLMPEGIPRPLCRLIGVPATLQLCNSKF
jgi:hypothetical protein